MGDGIEPCGMSAELDDLRASESWLRQELERLAGENARLRRFIGNIHNHHRHVLANSIELALDTWEREIGKQCRALLSGGSNA